MKIAAERIPVILGVGEINDRPAAGEQGLDSAELMVAALRAADGDAGGGWLENVDAIMVVPQISFDIDVPAALSAMTGIDQSAIEQAPIASGDMPVRLLNDAANAVASGKAKSVAIVGGEAVRTAATRGDGGPLFRGSLKNAAPLRRKYGLINPGEIYPLYENALRPALGQTLVRGQAESAEIWSRMSQVAEQSHGAWLRKARGADEIGTVSETNRLIAFPYPKLMVANSSVNQGAAVIVTSLAAALEAGVDEARIVYIGPGAAAHEDDDPLARAEWTNTPSMGVSINEAMKANGLTAQDLDHVELYSCFPCVPKMARRILGLSEDKPVTVHGGLTFGGGPVGNYMTHAIAAMVRQLRSEGRNGFLFANGGHCSHNHSIVLTRNAPTAEAFPQDYHGQEQADALRLPIPSINDEYEGDAPVETYTVVYGRNGMPVYGVVLSRSPDGARVISRVAPEDAQSIAFLTDGKAEPVGHIGRTHRVGDTLYWRAQP